MVCKMKNHIMTKPKIALFITQLDFGGAEKVVRILLEELQYRYEIHLILTVRLKNITPPEGIKTLYLNEFEKTSWRNFAKIPFQSRRLKTYLKDNDIPLIFSFLLRPNLIAAFTRYLGWRGIIILSERTSPIAFYSLQGRSGQFVLFLIKKIFPNADLIVPNSYGATHELRDILKINTAYQVIYNPLDIPETEEKGRALLNNDIEKKVDFDCFTFLCVGQLHPYKNHQLLLTAFAQLSDLDCQLLVVGNGVEEGRLKALAKALNIEKRVSFVGYDANPARFMTRADCFVTATNVEGLPNVHLEALCLGLPIISTDCVSGPRELLAPKSNINFQLKNAIEIAEFGILSPVNDAPVLASAMKLIYDLRNHYRKVGPTRASDFAKPLMVDKFVKMLDAMSEKAVRLEKTLDSNGLKKNETNI
jgi:N-acetylgalactosamine-N,N'-diacetylbacillosaminyl-diphospho-undecaprenol 4-alpha-N-acetylgalactosaminyltransferase